MYEDPQASARQNQALLYEYANNSLPLRFNESWAGRRLVEALSHLPPSILSSSLDSKFQKNQMLEREQKKSALASKDVSEASKSVIGNGKVRQMFDDRRRGLGIDKSHPLRPIMASTASTLSTNRRLENSGKRTGFSPTLSMQGTTTSRGRVNNNYPVSNGNNNVFRNNFDKVDNIDKETLPNEFSLLSLSSTRIVDSNVKNVLDLENNSNVDDSISNSSFVLDNVTTPKSNTIKLNPVITKKSPTNTSIGKPKSSAVNTGSRISVLSKTTNTSIESTPSKQVSLSTTIKATVKNTTNSKQKTFVLSAKPPPRITTPPIGMASCQYCQRHFLDERLFKHQDVCRKIMSKERKIFDASKHRIKGTDVEAFLKKRKVFNSTMPKSIIAAANKTHEAKNNDAKKSNWRKKHEDFLKTIREAKKVEDHLAKGGKLSDLPPPLPSANSDYIQCPHCNRRFNEAAAERHIPKCATMLHNKPKPNKKR